MRIAMRSISDLDPSDVKLFTHVGHFMFWYSAVEVGVTNLLAKALGYTDLDRFEVVTSGMDAQVKSSRLRADASKYMEVGRNLEARLKHFEGTFIPLRNKFAHRVPILEENGSRIRFAGSVEIIAQSKKAADQISTDDVFQKAEWLNWFASELAHALNHSALTGKLEIARPKTHLPRAPQSKK
jgi:hypothetical protein